MRIYGIIGWKGAGKTCLVERLVAAIGARGFSVSTVKHSHHDVDPDRPGSDSHRHRVAGASEVVLAGPGRFVLTHEHRGEAPRLAAILDRMAPVDLVLVEGFKSEPHPRIEVFREGAGHAPIQPEDPWVRAVASDAALALPVPVLDLDDTEAVADFILKDSGLVRSGFDTVIAVDWSGASVPSPRKPSSDAIWIGVASPLGETVSYHRTRADAEAHLNDLFAFELVAGRRVLAGFDFPFGYPEGFASRLTGAAFAPALWEWLEARIEDGPDNANNRFQLADRINADLPGEGPFWGRPGGLDLAHLPDRKLCDHAALGLAERRRVELAVPKAHPVWKLYTTGSVGSQALLGLPVIARLRRRFHAQAWPFEPASGPLVVAEIYPSLLGPAIAKATRDGEIKDSAQVRLMARALWRMARDGSLSELLEDVPDWPGRREEGWILGAGHAEQLRLALI
ncbi:molybdopterin-guanine dinucleotide biosynthesis protein B [Cereibacter azotoformans]|uniref:Molybdopterin-guanine dinucleotide biosynthesis protein B n=1 Tax=Cereibacter azotoformans TaxID=43057 RepID=A0A2T5K7S8_9RHOB|nr:molybdopterin-guanine dinucleotide biosynthesis protein B [Cereibacter azotoformans]AXQ94324.1 molybdopterin-guanine dinucleotide biosynthesis protein B [Cereibacter sphaeroides]MBO4167856.1 molybdopterin-guanine dinucleotide biosynthesis protein B [Cereibacter azotoformans]PTR18418.1 molybdopterin-guanine dinucleotide biosynthesis protein B [Cereibacter azotoformans]UIJ29869.1 molybdopterin-guanine dinucleotide biosynthesis protein B [Cereibacter azotoformans]